MLSESDPSFEVRFVASMPLKNRLVLVVRVPFTDGEMLPVPLMSDRRQIGADPGLRRQQVREAPRRRRDHRQLSALNRRNVAAVAGVSSSAPPVTVIDSVTAPIRA